jgi:2-C-methyl-D-erythritol 2,4-cyclodiphosphate synthase
MLRVGLGYDSHRFQPPGPLILGGLRIPFDNHLHGHSDGDAVCHALTDAILGAAGDEDLGQIFSDRDPANVGRDSVEMLADVVNRIRRKGFRVAQADVTIITESPRLADHKAAMRTRLAAALGVDVGDVSVKAKSNEGLGWIGRGEGIACIAIATLTTPPP